MKSTGIKIKYGNVAPGAKEDFAPTSAQVESFVDLSNLQVENLSVSNVGNPAELYNVVLDGGQSVFADDGTQKYGLWSNSISDENGNFDKPIVLTLESVGKYSSPGFTFTFDVPNNAFSTSINIKWYGDGELLSEGNYEPDSTFYFCSNSVDFFNKVVITFYSINMPFNRLRLRAIDYGYGTFFYGKNVRNIKLTQEIDPLSTSISINTTDFSLDLPGDVEYKFQERQPMAIYFNDELLATTFVDNFKRKSKTIWDISCSDYIDVLEKSAFVGGLYSNKNAVDLIGEIFASANVPFEISEEFEEEKVSGYIPYTNCREALMQICFAIGAVVDTSNSSVVKVFALKNTVEQTINLERIKQGQSFDTQSRVTGVSITSHSYRAIEETSEIYNAETGGFGDGILVVFSEPYHSLSISSGEIVQSGTNFAIINANDGCVLSGKKYEHNEQTKQKTNPLILAGDKQNVISVNSSATLISASNVDKALERCYNYFTRNRKINMKIVDGVHTHQGTGASVYGSFKYDEGVYGAEGTIGYIYDEPTSVGQTIIAQTEFLGDLQGLILSQSFSIVSNRILVKDSTLSVEG